MLKSIELSSFKTSKSCVSLPSGLTRPLSDHTGPPVPQDEWLTQCHQTFHMALWLYMNFLMVSFSCMESKSIRSNQHFTKNPIYIFSLTYSRHVKDIIITIIIMIMIHGSQNCSPYINSETVTGSRECLQEASQPEVQYNTVPIKIPK